jgi:hypothetical protein
LKPANQVYWIYPEEELDAGGWDKHGNGKLNRHTGALSIVDSVDYVLRWRPLPGSLAIDIQYRHAHVPAMVDPAVFIMKEQGLEDVNVFNGLSTVDRPRSLSVVIFVLGFLHQGANHEALGVIVDEFSTPSGAVACLQRYDVESFGFKWERKATGRGFHCIDRCGWSLCCQSGRAGGRSNLSTCARRSSGSSGVRGYGCARRN